VNNSSKLFGFINSKFIILVLACLVTFGFGKNGNISGYVTDAKTRDPLIGANVFLSETNLGSATDESGYYKIDDIPAGDYTIAVMFVGYERYEENIIIEDDVRLKRDFQLTVSAYKLQETTVRGKKRQDKITEAPAAKEIISSRDILRTTTTNLGSYLQGLKGVDFTSSGVNNYSISIRGFNSSFSSRLLTLTDGRVANIPALRVINYSTIPQSSDDVEKIEVVLGPATALYGANAHSGVINITSKSPATSEGLNLSFSGTRDDRNLKKLTGRWAKKFHDFSVKISTSYLTAHEWEYVSEREFKAHAYPWVGNPFRTRDGKDNNPWSVAPANGASISNADHWGVNTAGDTLAIGNGEANHGDLDGDGLAGEDWYNGYDDDGDGLVDEDYFYADGIDNAEPYTDTNGDGQYSDGEPYVDWNSNGVWDGADGVIDEGIDIAGDQWLDGIDNDGNGRVDDSQERTNGQAQPAWGTNMEDRNILVYDGRKAKEINGETSPWYDPDNFDEDGNWIGVDPHVRGDFKYDEDHFRYEFDTYTYDYGSDGIPGDPWQDLAGDGELQIGEPLSILGLFGDAQDVGLDGIPGTNDEGEGDGIWQPGDGWIDSNGNGIVDLGNFGEYHDFYATPSQDDWSDVWPPRNGLWDDGEQIVDCGQDGYCWDFDLGGSLQQAHDVFGELVFDDNGDPVFIYGPDAGENDGQLVPWDADQTEGDRIYDTGDGCFNCEDDFKGDFQTVLDTNGDGVPDYPDFDVENRKVEIRMDYDPTSDINLSLQSGYSWTKTQQVTGVGRYLADGWEYTYHQIRGRYKNWFAQAYINISNSGNTRGYNLGDIIKDQSRNLAAQLQNHFTVREYQSFTTNIVWGFDYFRTMPKTFGTILNDGPNGFDDDGDNILLSNDGIDNNGNGIIDEYGEGIDEKDEYDKVNTNEYGLYFQSRTNLSGDNKFELITAFRLDSHDQLKNEGLLFGPKVGLLYTPNERSQWRLTYGKAFNTPTTTTLYTDLYIGRNLIFDVFLKGNKDGTPYARVGTDYQVATPGYYDQDGVFHQTGNYGAGYFDGYEDRVKGAPYFFNIQDTNAPTDYIPLDTSRYLIYIPEPNGDGVMYTPEESINIPDVDAIKSEKVQTIELGYKGFLDDKTYFTIDYYASYYQDFFSPATFISPAVVYRYNTDGSQATVDEFQVVGILPANDNNSNPPYGTAWDGKDNDGDWAPYASYFGWGDTPDPGEWGYIDHNDITIIQGDTLPFRWYYPYEVLIASDNGVAFKPEYETAAQFWEPVGVDEYSKVTGLSEAELIETNIIGPDGNPLMGPGRAYSPPQIVLSTLNYGKVWIQGIDFGFTHFFSKKLILDGNFSWYSSTRYYNELTKKYDPINAPKYKFNLALKYDRSFGNIGISYRYVDRFDWSDGLWAGKIGPYNLIDLNMNYHITEHLTASITAMNIFNDMHKKELIGGAKMGRQIIFKLVTGF